VNALDGAKHEQALQYQSEPWRTVHPRLRNAPEGGHSRLKEASSTSLHDTRNRRIRGMAAQAVLLGVLLSADTMRKAIAWLDKATTPDGEIESTKRRRRKPSLQDYQTPPDGDIAA
jgi:hypothetical protein